MVLLRRDEVAWKGWGGERTWRLWTWGESARGRGRVELRWLRWENWWWLEVCNRLGMRRDPALGLRCRERWGCLMPVGCCCQDAGGHSVRAPVPRWWWRWRMLHLVCASTTCVLEVNKLTEHAMRKDKHAMKPGYTTAWQNVFCKLRIVVISSSSVKQKGNRLHE